jgi:hypothetical protein
VMIVYFRLQHVDILEKTWLCLTEIKRIVLIFEGENDVHVYVYIVINTGTAVS